ncbi:hypothetical protein ACU4HD_47060 [Cupriavidus basilensis]
MSCPMPSRLAVLAQARDELAELVEAGGAGVLTDIFGATPAGLAWRPGRPRAACACWLA